MANNQQVAADLLKLAKKLEQPLLGKSPNRAAIMAEVTKKLEELAKK